MFGERGGREECQLVAGAPRGGETKPVLDRGREFIYEDMCRQRTRTVLLQPSPGPSVCLPRGSSSSESLMLIMLSLLESLPFPLTDKPNLTYC